VDSLFGHLPIKLTPFPVLQNQITLLKHIANQEWRILPELSTHLYTTDVTNLLRHLVLKHFSIPPFGMLSKAPAYRRQA
jgi:hypothetical protein